MNGGPSELEAGSRTDAGRREANEDGLLCVDLPGGALLAAVADGMGGLEGGALASRVALATLKAAVENGRPLREAFRNANAAVLARSGEGRSGTTLVAAVIEGDRVRLAHVGDSRAYHRGPLGLSQLTRDHTVGAEAEARGEWAGHQVAGTRWGAGLTRSLGASDDVEIDELGPFTLGDNGWILLTSDGVHKALDLDTMEELLSSAPDAAAAADRLVSAAIEKGSDDNVTAVFVRRRASAGRKRSRGPQDPADVLAHRTGPSRERSWWLPGILAGTFLVLLAVALYVYLP